MVLVIITEGDTSLNETCFIRRWCDVGTIAGRGDRVRLSEGGYGPVAG